MEVVASVCTCQAASGGWGHRVLHAAMLGWLASYRCTLLGLYTIYSCVNHMTVYFSIT